MSELSSLEGAVLDELLDDVVLAEAVRLSRPGPVRPDRQQRHLDRVVGIRLPQAQVGVWVMTRRPTRRVA